MPSAHQKQEIYEDIANKRMEEIQDLSKHTNFNNLTYHYKGKNDPKSFTGFKGPLSFCKSIKESDTTLEKAEEQQKEFKLELNKTVKGSKKPEDQKSAISNIKTLYKSQEKVIRLFDNYSRIVSEVIYKTKHDKGLKILTPKQMLQRLPVALTQVKKGNTHVNLLNEIWQILYYLYQAKEITKKLSI